MSDEPKGACKGICQQYKAVKPKDGLRYAHGQVRCQQCDIFITRDGCHDKLGNPATDDTLGLYCNCCNYRVTSRPRNKFYNEKLKTYKEIKALAEQNPENENLNAPLDFEELKLFITETARPQANYQFVVIKTLLESNNISSIDNIVAMLEWYNRDKPSQDYRRVPVLAVLENRGIIIRDGDNYLLHLDKNEDAFSVLELISLCNQKIYENKLKENTEYYIALGPWDNWNYTIENLPMRWGVADTTQSNIGVFNSLREEDLVFYYATKDEPTYFSKRGFFGVGIVSKKTIEKSEKYWPIEQKTDKPYYTNKLYLDTIKFVQTDDELLPIIEGLPLVKGLNHITDPTPLKLLLESAKQNWNIVLTPTQNIHYWKIAPGESAEFWDQQRNLGLIGIRWNELGDLSKQTFEQIHEKLKTIWPGRISNNSRQFQHFTNIKKGDIIIANKGKKRIVGIGRVIGDYEFRPDLPFSHTYPVDWFDTTEREIPEQSNWFITVTEVSKETFDEIMTSPQLNKQTFEEFVRKFDKDPSFLDQAYWYFTEEEREKQRKEFLSKFSPQKISDLKLEEYSLGIRDQDGDRNRTNFCYYLENNADAFGSIWGSTAQKFGIFFQQEKNKFNFKSKYRTADEAFNVIKSEITTFLNAGLEFQNDHNWEKLSSHIDKKYNIHRNVRSKILAVYFPNTFLMIHSKKHVDKILDFLEIPRGRLHGELTLKQGALIEYKNSHPIMKNWTVEDFSYFLWYVIIDKLGAGVDDDDDATDWDDVDFKRVNLDNTLIFEDDKLELPSQENLIEAKKAIKEKILIDDQTIDQIISTLVSEKNILLVGPVGSGKTHLATILPELVWKDDGKYHSEVYTATADWTTQDVIGGIYPKIDSDNNMTYGIQKGCIAETVSKNWLDGDSSSEKRVSYQLNGQSYKGVWLVIDEFNRANIDRAFGQLFTALEYGKLQIPTTAEGKSFKNLQIPKDYRIIGTLNTSDKHFLHTLSDALKRRFAIIEIPAPTYKQKQSELFYVVKKATDDLKNIPNKLAFDETKKEIISNTDSAAEQILETLHLLISYLREVKPLGTALMISMFKFMLVHHHMNNDWQKSLDLALVSTVMPQLENLPYWTLKVIRAVFCYDVGQFLKTDQEIQRDGSEKYHKDFEAYVKFLKNIKQPSNTIPKRFRSGTMTDEDYLSLNLWSDIIKKPSLPKFRDEISRLIEEKGFTEESIIENE